MAGSERARRWWGWILGSALVAALFCGTGPGVLLIDGTEPLMVLGVEVPRIYAWCLLWYVVEAVCVVLACVIAWRQPDEE